MEAMPAKIIHYFSEFKQYLVPLFQRPYTWTEKQWRNLWDDIVSFYDYEAEQGTTHFMGAVVTMPARSVPVGVSKFLVIDGQQRLTTIALLLCAIRDFLTEADAVLMRRIQNHYLTNEGFEGFDQFKLLPTQSDRPPYCELVLKRQALENSQFKSAYDFFCRRLKERNGDNGQIDPKRVLDIVERRLMAVMINIGDADDPYLIFESLNFKGAPLEQADLVRNYFLMRFQVNEQQEVYDDLWLPMERRLGSNLTEFMRHFLGSEGQEVRKGDVYAAIKRLVSDESSVKLLMRQMERLSELYRRIAVSPDGNDEIGEYLARFKRLDFGTVYPLLLSLYDDYEDGQFSRAEFVTTLKILESYIIRRMVAGVPSNSLSDVFISLCKDKPITDAPSPWLSAALVRETKNRRWPSDGEFREAWMSTPIYNSRRACPVILQCLEEQFGHKEAADVTEASVEHVMPQTLTPEWEAALGADAVNDHVKWLHTIGNLTLSAYNPELSNKPYSQKRVVYANSHYDLNRYFSAIEDWDAPRICCRAEALFAVALQLWPRPDIEPQEDQLAVSQGRANFYPDCIRLAERHLGFRLSRITSTRYEAGEQGTRLVCIVSTEHNDGVPPYYWFAVHRAQLDFLEGAESRAWLCLGCGSPERTLLIPVSYVVPLLNQMSVSLGEDRHYWHVVIQRKDGELVLRFLNSVDGPDLSEFLLPTGELTPAS